MVVLSKENYVDIAAILRASKTKDGIVRRLVDYLQVNNPRFDAELFLKAVAGFPDVPGFRGEMGRAVELNQELEVLARGEVTSLFLEAFDAVGDALAHMNRAVIRLERADLMQEAKSVLDAMDEVSDVGDKLGKRLKIQKGQRVSGKELPEARCGCASSYLKSWTTLRNLLELATVGGPEAPTFDMFPSWVRNRKEHWIQDLEEMERDCGVDIGPGSPLNPVIPRLRALDTFAMNHTPFQTIGEIGQLRNMLVLAIEECK